MYGGTWRVNYSLYFSLPGPSVSPFASSGSSVRTTPDLLRAENQDPAIVAAGMPIGRLPPGNMDADWSSLAHPGASGHGAQERSFLAAEIQVKWYTVKSLI